ncbi:MAG TPA: hypothetical protein VLX92_18915, partial [Kofleriaceae bacterium]|nr:hypothetical protein [Kofleriaceae bacterium]
SVALALDGSGAPVVGWVEAGVAEVARWNGGAWAQLASPGPAGALALAGGSPVVAARFGAEADVSELAPDDSWQAIGAVALPAAVVGEPQLAADRDRVALAWIDAGDQLRTARYRDGAWSALVPLPLGAPASGFDRVSVAARGDAIAVAWDQWAGSFAVLAASATGDATALAQLGRPLDVALDDDAVAPAIALDASGAPIVAWTELSGTAQRGAIARWNGSAWAIVGGPSWLADPSAAPSRAALALGPGDAPVVATSQRAAIVVARFNGPAVAGDGIARRASLAGCAIDPSAPPAWLSQTGCFAIATPGRPTPHPGLVPYGIGVELWSDGAKKRRWLGVPDGQAMTVSATGAWTPPLGGFVVKEFAIDTTPGDPSTRRAIETRFLVRDAAGYHGVSYRWTLDGMDATLQPDAEQTFDWPMDDGSVHPHFYPSRSDCLECHNPTYGPLLGPRAPQLAGWFDYGGVIADQPSTLADLGVGPAQTAAPFASPEDPSQPVELRVRGYMAANCAHCHNPSDVAIHDLRYATPLAQTNLCPDIVPGDPAASKVYQLVSSRPGMPPLGTLAIDPLAVGLLGGWISSMTSCP